MSILDQLADQILELGKAALEDLVTGKARTPRTAKPKQKAQPVDGGEGDDWRDDDDDWRDSDGAAPRLGNKDIEMVALLGIAGGGAWLYSRARSRAKETAAAVSSSAAAPSSSSAGASTSSADASRTPPPRRSPPPPRRPPRSPAAAALDDARAARLLGVDVDADLKKIKAAFRQRVRQVHPDLARNPNTKADARTRELIEARDRLLRRAAAHPRKE